MRAVLFLSLLCLSACASPIPPDPLPACVETWEYERVDTICHFDSRRNWCELVPIGEAHPVTTCR